MGNKEHLSVWNPVTLATVVAIGFGFLVTKYRLQILSQLRKLLSLKDPLRNQQVHVVDNVDECRVVMRDIRAHCEEYNVLGFDCEWVTIGSTRKPVALLQLATHRGLCVLIRLCNLQTVPIELREILQDDNIIKVGVQPYADAAYLVRDYGACVASTLDLRHLARDCGYRPGGLAKLSEEHLKVKLDKDWRVRCSDWEATSLNHLQIEYAAKDAHVGIELFKIFADKLKSKTASGNRAVHLQEFVEEYCFRYLDVSFSGKMLQPYMNSERKASNGLNLSSTKIRKANMPTRSKPLYENCFLQAPDGELLCTFDSRKANWYINKGLAEIVIESPLTVRLKFEPSGRNICEAEKYYETVRKNQCVVCGNSEEYVRKNIVPREYRKYFPGIMKKHTSHDVLLLCPICHQKSSIADLQVREQLAEQCNAPVISKNNASKSTEDPILRELKSISRVLLVYSDKIPERRKDELLNRLKELCPDVDDFSDEFLQSYTDIETSEINDSVHGAKVVEYYQNSDQGLVGLERLWREHFVKVMKPKYLPELWSLEHNVQRLEVRAADGRMRAEMRATDVRNILGTQNINHE